MGLILSERHLAALLAQADAERPNEACGLLGGTGERVCRVYPAENIHHSPTVFELNPAQQIAAFLDIEAAGWELMGLYHSHPAGPATPSPTDIAQAYYPESVYVIISPGPAPAKWQVRGFKIEDRLVSEVPIVIEAHSQPPECPDRESVQ